MADARERPITLDVTEGVSLRMVPGLQDKYAAGSDGHIYCYSDARVNAKRPRPFRLSEAIGSTGYPFVCIIIDGQRKSVPVHRLVCSAFHGIAPTKVSIVRHLDGDPTNSLPDNLAWGSYAQNEADKRRHGRVADGERHGAAKLTEDAVRIIRASVPFGLWNATDAAQVFGVHPSTIRRIAAGKRGWQRLIEAAGCRIEGDPHG